MPGCCCLDTILMRVRTVAITPSKSKNIPFEQVKKICQTDALAGLQAMYQASRAREGNAKPFSFIYMSGAAAERDQSKKPKWMPEYCLMRVCFIKVLLPFSIILIMGRARQRIYSWSLQPRRREVVKSASLNRD